MIEQVKPFALQAILYFMMAKMDGQSRLEAIQGFLKSELSKNFKDLTVGNVWGLSEAAGY